MGDLYPIPLDTVLRETGGLAAGAQVRLLTMEGVGEVPIYDLPDATEPVAQPIVADEGGRTPPRWTEAGEHRLLITGYGADRTIPIKLGVASVLSPELSGSVASTGDVAARVAKQEIVPLSYYGTVATGIGADHTALFEAFYDDVMNNMDAGFSGKKVLAPPGADLRSGGSTVRRRMMVDLQGSMLRALGPDPLFTSAADHSAEFTLENGAIVADSVVVRMQGNPALSVGQIPTIRNLYVVSKETIDSNWADYGDGVNDFFQFRNVDRVVVEGVAAYGANRLLVIDGVTGVDRGNTQVRVSGLFGSYCRLGLDLSQVHLGEINADLARMGTGVIVRNGNRLLRLNNCNVQMFGHPDWTWAEHDGRGYVLNMSSYQRGIEFDRCEAKQVQPNAVAGFEHWAATGTTYSDQQMPDPIYRHCSPWDAAGAPAGYRPVDLWGKYAWEGQWPATEANARTHMKTTSIARRNDGQIRPSGITVPVSFNLLPIQQINDLEDLPFSSGAGSATVGAATSVMAGAKKITLTGVISRRTNTFTLNPGWHTLVVQGYSTSLDFVVTVDQAFGTNDRLAQTLLGANDAQVTSTEGETFRIPFYVPTAGLHRWGVAAFAAGSKEAVVGRVSLQRGHVPDIAPQTPQGEYPDIASAATLPKPTTRVARITGTTGITNITAGHAGQEFTLIFSGTPTVTDGGNLTLAGSLTPTAGSTLSLVCNGSSWFETSRSVN